MTQEIINFFSVNGWGIGLFIFIIVLTYIIDTFNTTHFEYHLKSNSEKVKMHVAPILLITSLFSIILIAFVAWDIGDGSVKTILKKLPISQLVTYIVLFTFILFVYIASVYALFIFIINKYVIIKPIFYLVNSEESGDRWRVIRAEKDKVVLRNSVGTQYRLLLRSSIQDNIFEKRYVASRVARHSNWNNSWRHRTSRFVDRCNWIFFVFAVVCIVLVQYSKIYVVLGLCLTIVFLVLVVLNINNKVLQEVYNNQELIDRNGASSYSTTQTENELR
ncbi:hypothetical protein V1503_06130 [Bacillus sp. SCS-151]|uniref:hypothetical protein n=1 Tax=Nanhaiella sioensis TaxID=3115293 RepID=UPI00397C2E72